MQPYIGHPTDAIAAIYHRENLERAARMRRLRRLGGGGRRGRPARHPGALARQLAGLAERLRLRRPDSAAAHGAAAAETTAAAPARHTEPVPAQASASRAVPTGSRH